MSTVANDTELQCVYGLAFAPNGTAVYNNGANPPALWSISTSSSPSSPVNVTTTPAASSAVVSWSAPSFTGGTLSSYIATASPGGAYCTRTSTSCTITGLTNGTPYSVTVTATNTLGTSSASDSVSVTPATPTTPTTTPAVKTAAATTLAATGSNFMLPAGLVLSFIGLGGLGLVGAQRRRRRAWAAISYLDLLQRDPSGAPNPSRKSGG